MTDAIEKDKKTSSFSVDVSKKRKGVTKEEKNDEKHSRQRVIVIQ